ncbi:MAG: hypothetical protein O2910_00870 [Proteobacteria bacterium]|nr:hypothetical protein [Pseudomonadota bacterium]
MRNTINTGTGGRQRQRLWLRGVTCALVGLLTLASPVRALECMSVAEMNAERVRSLQSGLMVAALKCVHRPELDLHTSYNGFVGRFERELIVHSDVLQDYFRRAHGSKHRTVLNQYVTSLANRYSIRTFDFPTFCDDMALLSASILVQEAGAIQNVSFDMSHLAPGYSELCESAHNRDFPWLQGGLPDLATVHMPDLDEWLRRDAQAFVAPQLAE